MIRRIKMKIKIKIKRFAVIALSLMAAGHFAAAATEKPNIVLFLVDDMGLMDTSAPMLTDAAGRVGGGSIERVAFRRAK